MVNVYLFHDLLSVPILHHYHPDSRSKVNVTRPTNAHTVNVLYLPNRKAYELQNWYTDGARRPASTVTSKVKVHVTPLTGINRVDNLPTNFGLPRTFRLIGQHLSDVSRDLDTCSHGFSLINKLRLSAVTILSSLR